MSAQVGWYLYLILLLLLTGVVAFIVYQGESFVLVVLSNVLLSFCVLFFISENLLWIFICLEVVTFSILLVLLFYGYQIENISSSWYLLLLGVSTSIVLLYFIFNTGGIFMTLEPTCLSNMFVAFLVFSFFMKLPVFLLHVWLPKVHVESPTIGSVLLASLLLKLGGWGLILFLWVLLPGLIAVLTILILSIFICGLYCTLQSDGKALVGYSSVFHIAGFLLFLVTYVVGGEVSSLLIMVAHGLVSAILFLYVGSIYNEVLSREVFNHQGLINGYLVLGVSFLGFFLINSGLPPSISFVSEIIGIVAVFTVNSLGVLLLCTYFMVGFYYSLSYGLSIFLGRPYFNIVFSPLLVFFTVCIVYGLLFIF